jgi:hypothetical protein
MTFTENISFVLARYNSLFLLPTVDTILYFYFRLFVYIQHVCGRGKGRGLRRDLNSTACPLFGGGGEGRGEGVA